MPKNKIYKYTLGSELFYTWDGVITYTRQLLAKGCRVLNKKEHAFAKDLFSFHPNGIKKLQGGIASIRVGVPEYGSGFCFIIKDLNGFEQDISHKKCRPLSKKDPIAAKERSLVQDRLKAYRQAISFDIDNFWQSAEARTCNKCQVKYDIQVDHVKPFISLVNDFEQLHSFEKYPRLKRTNDSLYAFQFSRTSRKDSLFIEAWQAFHKREAQLQFLCSKCNRKKHASGARYQPRIAA